jgi:UDP-sugar diphosphatase
VAVLLYHEEKKAFLLVKQFRAPVYLNDNSKTYTYELCAGLVDKDKSLIEIAKEEIDEECGYNVKIEIFKK